MKSVGITIATLASLTFAILFSFYSEHTKTSTPSFGIALTHNQYNVERSLPSLDNFIRELNIPTSKVEEVMVKWTNISIEPKYWGENVPGVMNRLNTSENVIALTFDACGGNYGSDYDKELIEFLREEQVPATLFFNARWIKANKDIFLELSKDPLFQIENHGTEHLPLSKKGSTAWGIKGTTGIDEIIEEVMGNQELIFTLTGHTPKYFRSGTAYYDEVAIEIVQDLGLVVVNYDILGDAGATFTSSQVKNSLLNARPGSIALLHMNQPSSGTAAGVKEAVPLLRNQGFKFVFLDEFDLKK